MENNFLKQIVRWTYFLTAPIKIVPFLYHLENGERSLGCFIDSPTTTVVVLNIYIYILSICQVRSFTKATEVHADLKMFPC